MAKSKQGSAAPGSRLPVPSSRASAPSAPGKGTRSAPEQDAIEEVVDGRAWSEFCRLLEQAGQAILADGNPTDPLDRAEGFRMLTRLLRGALESRLEFSDPRHPQLVCTCHETIKIVAENPDTLYLGAALDGRDDYRIWGTRGEARWISFNSYEGGGFGGGGAGVGTALHEKDLLIDESGCIEIVLSQKPHPGNWLRLTPETKSIGIRQTFLDKRAGRPAQLHIERLGADALPPAPLDPEHLYRALTIAGHYVRGVAEIGASWARRQAAHPNVFADAQGEDTKAFADPQIRYQQAYFELAPEQALVVTFRPPACDYWMIALHNHWMETLDYRFHQITLNSHSAEIRDDGTVECVIAHRDPGVANWLDTAGHRRGIVGVRWVGDDVEEVVPATRVVELGG
jgi:hypothetical protein